MEKKPSRWPLRIVLSTLLTFSFGLLATTFGLLMDEDMLSASQPQITVAQQRLRKQRREQDGAATVTAAFDDEEDATESLPPSRHRTYDAATRRSILRGELLLETKEMVQLLKEVASTPELEDLPDLVGAHPRLDIDDEVRLAYAAAAVSTFRVWAQEGNRPPVRKDFDTTQPGQLAYLAVETAFETAVLHSDAVAPAAPTAARGDVRRAGRRTTSRPKSRPSPWKTVRLAILQLRDVTPQLDALPTYRAQRAQILKSVKRLQRQAVEASVLKRGNAGRAHDRELWRVGGLLGGTDAVNLAIVYVEWACRNAAAARDPSSAENAIRSAVEIVARIGSEKQKVRLSGLLAKHDAASSDAATVGKTPDPLTALRQRIRTPDPITRVRRKEGVFLR